MLIALLLFIVSFLIGSVPSGVLIARTRDIDLSKTGSGNIGATNVFRTLGPAYGVAVFVLDFLKGYVPVLLARIFLISPFLVILCGASAVLGHMFSPFVNFKGGKGVATGLGVVFGIAPRIFIFCLVLGISIIAVTGYVSLASITGAIMLSLLMFTSQQPAPYVWGMLLLCIFAVYKHIPNMKRLIKGTENKISWKK